MRSKASFSLLLILVVLALSAWHAPPTAAAEAVVQETCWRRTSDGWERAAWVASEDRTPSVPLHPALIGAMELLLVLTVVTAFSEGKPKR